MMKLITRLKYRLQRNHYILTQKAKGERLEKVKELMVQLKEKEITPFQAWLILQHMYGGLRREMNPEVDRG